jgi:hypothetical protein
MAARLKDKGREELAAFKRRVKRQETLERISKGDADYLIGLIDKIDAHVIKMSEKPDIERSFF